MLEAVRLLDAAGLTSAEVDAWRSGEPERATSFEAASTAACAHLVRGEELLGRLPPRSERNEAEAGAAAFLIRSLSRSGLRVGARCAGRLSL